VSGPFHNSPAFSQRRAAEVEAAMSHYKVMVDDNFHYMDEDERYQHGVFSTAEEAIAACKRIVDDDLEQAIKPGMTAAELYESYTHFGSDPFVVPLNPAEECVKFSAWDYAKEQSKIVASLGTSADKTIGKSGS
jgi:hypothetical protein